MRLNLTITIIMILSMLLASTIAESTLKKFKNIRMMLDYRYAPANCNKSASYQFDERGPLRLDSNRCLHDCNCDGERKCNKYFYCEGFARP